MPYVRAFSSLGCPELGLGETLALARRHGIPAVELRTVAGSTDLPGIFAREYGSPASLAAVVAGQPVRIVAFGTSLRLADPKEEDFEALLRLCPWAEALGVRALRVFDGWAPERPQAAIAGTWRRWRDERSARGWDCDIMVETHDALLTADAIRELVEFAPGVRILWDSHHTWRKGGEDPLATWAAIRSHVTHVHVKDSIGRPGGRHPFTYVLPGDGEFPMAPLRAVLDSEFGGPVSLEWERHWHPHLPPLDEALCVAAARRWW